MDANAPKNRKLIAQYPFLVAVLHDGGLEPLGEPIANLIHDLSIRVEKADGDLMYRRADNIGLGGEQSFLLNTKRKRRKHVGKCGEYLFAIGKDGMIINRTDWPRNDNEQRSAGDVYGWNVFWGTKTENGFSNPLWNETKYLVWLTVNAWHEDIADSSNRFGKFLERTVDVVIYTEPEEGFEKLQEESVFEDHIFINSNLLMEGAIKKDYKILSINGRLAELCKTFEDEVYLNGMKKVLDEGEFRGASGRFGPVKVLCAEMCGYDRVWLQDSTSWISFQMRPSAKTLYVLGMGGTLPQLRNLVRTVVKLWGADATMRQAFKPDEHVSVLGDAANFNGSFYYRFFYCFSDL